MSPATALYNHLEEVAREALRREVSREQFVSLCDVAMLQVRHEEQQKQQRNRNEG